ncbi:family 2 glycosyl transferase [Flammeovirgaceae bacterium 311]|nr:family 2 glycosyl transferase [Flammeovirgaceae bacterium 311]
MVSENAALASTNTAAHAGPRVSVLLPFYKAAATLEKAINSILEQSLQQWELLLINNNADAATAAIALRYSTMDKRILLLHESRQGIAFALNKGLAHTRAPLIARMDADDVSLPQRLQKQYQYLLEHPCIGLVACQCSFISQSQAAGGYQRFVQWQNSLVSPQDHAINRFIESPVAHPSVMFRRELIERWGGYSTEPVPEDYELWLRWMSKGILFTKLQEELVLWQDHPARLSRTHPNYSESAFLGVKMKYLAGWVHAHVAQHRKTVICGASREIRRKAALLASYNVPIYGFTDVKERNIATANFIPIDQLALDRKYFFINLISKRGVGSQVKKFLISMGFQEGPDFILAG